MIESSSNAFHSGFVALIGRPNVGKSTLMNALLGTKVAAVSPWPQTTRKRQMGILTQEDVQIIFIDTPGVHNPLHKLGEHMNQEAIDVLEESDMILFLVDISQPPSNEDLIIVDLLSALKRPVPILMVLNKVDLIDEDTLEMHQSAFAELLLQVESLAISSTERANLDHLIEKISAHLPENPPFFPEDQLTDLYEREIAADLIREAILENLRAEVPHSIAIRIDEYREREETGAYIAVTLFVERESQKGIVIGQGGEMLKKIGTTARQKIESMNNRDVYLNIRVKVRKNWRNDESALRLFGFYPSKD
jgi:GTP-binding protein Era